jgi:hypothetical protein
LVGDPVLKEKDMKTRQTIAELIHDEGMIQIGFGLMLILV